MRKHILGIIGAAIFFGAAIGAAVFFAEPLPIFEHEWTFVFNFMERTPDGIVEHKDFCEGEKDSACAIYTNNHSPIPEFHPCLNRCMML